LSLGRKKSFFRFSLLFFVLFSARLGVTVDSKNVCMLFLKIHKIRLALLFCGFTMLLSNDAAAQIGRDDTYFMLGIAVPIGRVRDVAHSPLPYSGEGLEVRVGYERLSPQLVSRFTVSYLMGDLAPRTKPRPKRILSALDWQNIQVTYSYFQRINGANAAADALAAYVGGAINFTADLRQYTLPSNNVFGYQFNTTFNVGTHLRQSIGNATVKDRSDLQWHWNDEATLALFAHTIRPTYIGMPPIADGRFSPKTIIKNATYGTLNRVFRFTNRAEIEQSPNDYHSRRLNYTWQIIQNRAAEKVTAVQGGLGFESWFKL
jgi:hypothetical protein